jgi:hypothetical protein
VREKLKKESWKEIAGLLQVEDFCIDRSPIRYLSPKVATKNQIVATFSLEEAITSHIERSGSIISLLHLQPELTHRLGSHFKCVCNKHHRMEDCTELGNVDLHFRGLK